METPANAVHIQDLAKAIDAAGKQNILMFCSAKDGGMQDNRHDKLYPAACSDKVFCIG